LRAKPIDSGRDNSVDGIRKLETKVFEVNLGAERASVVFDEISAICYGGISFGEIGEFARLPARVTRAHAVGSPPPKPVARGKGLRLLTFKPLFSGPAVERTPELDFQRRDGEVELARADARARKISEGDVVKVSSNGTSVTLRARIAGDLPVGSVRIPREAAAGLHELVEVTQMRRSP
jgi:translation initiation factor IF-1